MTAIRAFFLPNLGHFFLIFKKRLGRPPPTPPYSYAPATSIWLAKKKTFAKDTY